MRIKLVKLAAAGAVLFNCSAIYCQTRETGGAVLLSRKLDASSSAMGEAYTAVRGAIATAQYNPSGILGIPKLVMELNYRKEAADMNTASVWLGFGKRKHAFAFGISAFNAGETEMYDTSGLPVNFTAQSDLLLSAGYAFSSNRKTVFGAGAKFLRSTLAEAESAKTSCFDAGLNHKAGGVIIGLSVQNIGRGIKYIEEPDTLPLTYRVGLSRKFKKILTSADAVKSGPNSVNAHAGIEYSLLQTVKIRAGYRSGFANDALRIGFGYLAKSLAINYAYSLMSQIDSNHLISVTLRL